MVRYDHLDIAHDVWIWFQEHPDKQPKNWLIRCRILDQIRKRKKPMRGLLFDPEKPPPRFLLPTTDLETLIEKANLTELEQQILYYRHILNLSYKQISRELEIPRARVSPLSRNILERLKGIENDQYAR